MLALLRCTSKVKNVGMERILPHGNLFAKALHGVRANLDKLWLSLKPYGFLLKDPSRMPEKLAEAWGAWGTPERSDSR